MVNQGKHQICNSDHEHNYDAPTYSDSYLFPSPFLSYSIIAWASFQLGLDEN